MAENRIFHRDSTKKIEKKNYLYFKLSCINSTPNTMQKVNITESQKTKHPLALRKYSLQHLQVSLGFRM